MNRHRLWTRVVTGAATLCAATVVFAAPAYADEQSARQQVGADEYIVTLRDGGQFQASEVTTTAQSLSSEYDGRLVRAYKHALKGFLVKLPAARAAALAKDPRVRTVSPNRTGQFTDCQTDPNPCQIEITANSWGQDYIDGRTNNVDGRYHYDSMNSGFGVTVYVLDSGLGDQIVNHDYNNRASRGPNFRYLNGHEGPWPWTDSRDDCGHGSNVAGVAASSTYGVARGASLVALRIGTGCWDPFGQFYVSDVIAAIDWVIDQQQTGSRSVINFSATVGGGDDDLDAAFTAALQAGIPVVTGSGNEGTDTCAVASPQRLPGVITVGAHRQDGLKASFSNYGSCVDFYAPGESVRTLSKFNGQYSTVSGTSFSAPHAAGLVARFMQEWELFPPSPAVVQSTLVHNATPSGVRKNMHASWFRQPSPTCEVFDETYTDVNIPATGYAESPIQITGCFDDDGLGQYYVGNVRLFYTLVHPRPSDVKLELVSTGTNPSIHLVRSPGLAGTSGVAEVLITNKPRLGTWKLRATDTVSGQTGYLSRWVIEF